MYYPFIFSVSENMIYQGLDNDEANFLNFVHQRQAELEEKQYMEEIQQVKDFRISFSVIVYSGTPLIQPPELQTPL